MSWPDVVKELAARAVGKVSSKPERKSANPPSEFQTVAFDSVQFLSLSPKLGMSTSLRVPKITLKTLP